MRFRRSARGENAGRTLEEFNVVRNLRTLGVWKGQAQSFPRPSGIAAFRCHGCGGFRSAVRASPDHRSRRPRTALSELISDFQCRRKDHQRLAPPHRVRGSMNRSWQRPARGGRTLLSGRRRARESSMLSVIVR